jgi:hypothetical protein
MAIYNNDRDPNEEMWEKQQFDIEVENERLNKHKDMMKQVVDLNNELIDIQVEKFKILCDFLEYEEALTKDKDTASRIQTLLKGMNVWK